MRHAEQEGAAERILRAVRALPLWDYPSKGETVRSPDVGPALGRSASDRLESPRDRDKPMVAEHTHDPARADAGKRS